MNKWTDGKQIVTAKECPGEYWYPVVSDRRVRGASYTPYVKGSEAWLKAANRALASRARSNFERR
jgi:hypothetical protein